MKDLVQFFDGGGRSRFCDPSIRGEENIGNIKIGKKDMMSRKFVKSILKDPC
jgi:hypothetical protein